MRGNHNLRLCEILCVCGQILKSFTAMRFKTPFKKTLFKGTYHIWNTLSLILSHLHWCNGTITTSSKTTLFGIIKEWINVFFMYSPERGTSHSQLRQSCASGCSTEKKVMLTLKWTKFFTISGVKHQLYTICGCWEKSKLERRILLVRHHDGNRMRGNSKFLVETYRDSSYFEGQ